MWSLLFNLDRFAEVARVPARRVIGQYLALAGLTALAICLSTGIAAGRLSRWLEPHLDRLPTIEIRNGQASVDIEQPWVLRLANEGGFHVVLIIDTTGERRDFHADEIGLFLKKRHLLLKTPERRMSLSLARVPDVVLGPSLLKEWLKRAVLWATLLGGLLGLVWSLVVKPIQALVLALVARIATWSRQPPLDFSAALRVGFYALTPAVLVDCATWVLHLRFHFTWGFASYFAIAAIYTIIGARRVPAADSPPNSPHSTDPPELS